MTESILELGKYGVVGVIIALILVIVLLIKYYHKLTTNHINHSNEIFNKNTEALTKFNETLNSTSEKELEVLKELKDEVRHFNGKSK